MQPLLQPGSYFVDEPENFLHFGSSTPNPCLKRIVQAHGGVVNAIEPYTKNYFATASDDQTVHIWNRTRDCSLQPTTSTLRYNQALVSLCLHQDGILIGATNEGKIIFWSNTRRVAILKELDANHYLPFRERDSNHPSSISCLAMHTHQHGGIMLAGISCFLQAWRVDGQKMLGITRVSEYEPISCIQPLDDSKIALGIDGSVSIWEKPSRRHSERTYRNVQNLYDEPSPTSSYVTTMALLSPQTLAITLSSGRLKVIDLQSCKLIANFAAHGREVTTICKVSEQILVTGSNDTMLKLWDLRANECIAAFTHYPERVTCALVTDENTLTAASFSDSISTDTTASLTFWDMRK